MLVSVLTVNGQFLDLRQFKMAVFGLNHIKIEKLPKKHWKSTSHEVGSSIVLKINRPTYIFSHQKPKSDNNPTETNPFPANRELNPQKLMQSRPCQTNLVGAIKDASSLVHCISRCYLHSIRRGNMITPSSLEISFGLLNSSGPKS